eukprot:6197999-Pleurochrysis_carterae.AAC.3
MLLLLRSQADIARWTLLLSSAQLNKAGAGMTPPSIWRCSGRRRIKLSSPSHSPGSRAHVMPPRNPAVDIGSSIKLGPADHRKSLTLPSPPCPVKRSAVSVSPAAHAATIDGMHSISSGSGRTAIAGAGRSLGLRCPLARTIIAEHPCP